MQPREAVQEECEVLIIGGGSSGVWYWNRYPNAQCDIEVYVYFPLLEETGYMPSSKYPPATEIYEYARIIGQHFHLYDRALFHTAATTATWDEGDQRWIVATDRGDEIRARYLIRSSGALGTPVFPNVPGIDTFPGRIFHSSRWDYDHTGGSQFEPLVNLRDKKVAVVGSGASAVQVVTALAGQVEHLYVVQRTPGPAVGEHDVTPTDPEQWRDQPEGWQRERMLNYDANTSGHPQPVDLVQDQFSKFFSANATANNIVEDLSRVPAEDVMAVRELADMKIMEHVRSACDEIVQDPATADQLKPWYGFGCKRVTFDDGYLAAFNREDVTLIDAPSPASRPSTAPPSARVVANSRRTASSWPPASTPAPIRSAVPASPSPAGAGATFPSTGRRDCAPCTVSWPMSSPTSSRPARGRAPSP